MPMRARATFLVATEDGRGVWVQSGQEVTDTNILQGRESLFEAVEDAPKRPRARKKR